MYIPGVYKALSSLSRAGFASSITVSASAMQPNALQYRYCPIDGAMTISVVLPFYALQSLTYPFANVSVTGYRRRDTLKEAPCAIKDTLGFQCRGAFFSTALSRYLRSWDMRVVTADIVPHGRRRRVGTSERVNEGTFIILLTHKDRSPSLKHRDTMPMRPVVSTSLHLSIQLVLGKKRKNEPPFSKCSVAINLSSSPRAARIVRT